jgi:methyltransferase (TIGR00027 family)
MALFRALESTGPAGPKGTRLFDDPYAVRFLRPSLRGLVRASRHRPGRAVVLGTLDRLWPGARASGVARTRFIDDALVTASREDELEQVVLLGAGFDCRAQRLPLGSDPIYLEVDRPDTQESKRRRLGHAGGRVRYVPCDFEAGSLAASLESAGFESNRSTFVVWEGVTNYLSSEAVDDVLDTVRGIAPGSVLLFTYVDEPWTFGLDPSGLADFLKQRGLARVCDESAVDYRARYLGSGGRDLRGYEFYRAAIAKVCDAALPQKEAIGCRR